MVRSHSDAPKGDLFHLSQAIRDGEKYLDVSLSEIGRQLDKSGKCEQTFIHEIETDGELVGSEPRLNINCEAPRALGWTISLKLHLTRIDCIDWEGGRGWHRHEWDPVKRSAERHKVPVQGFDDAALTRDDFLVRALQEMRILLNKVDHGNDDELRFD